MGKKDEYRFNLRFDETDEMHRLVVKYLNSCGHNKAKYIVRAFLAYWKMSGKSLLSYVFPEIDAELKKEFSAYVKTAIKNTQKQYLIKKGKILDNEIAMDDEGIDEILQKQIEDLFDKMDLNVDMVLSDEINVNSFLDQINDPVLYVSLCSLKELQQKVLMLRIVYVKSFDDIGGILNMTAKQAENSYYNAIRKIRKQMGDNFG